jgi:hypothetical protein
MEKKVTIRIEEDMHKTLKKYCIDYNTSIQNFVIELITERISNQDSIKKNNQKHNKKVDDWVLDVALSMFSEYKKILETNDLERIKNSFAYMEKRLKIKFKGKDN